MALDLKSAIGDSTNTNDNAFPISLPMLREGEVGSSTGPLASGLAAAGAAGGGTGGTGSSFSSSGGGSLSESIFSGEDAAARPPL